MHPEFSKSFGKPNRDEEHNLPKTSVNQLLLRMRPSIQFLDVPLCNTLVIQGISHHRESSGALRTLLGEIQWWWPEAKAMPI